MPRDRDSIEKALAKKGFRKEDSHHRYYTYYDGDKCTGIYTYISTGTKYKVYDDHLLSQMYKQLKLDDRQQLLRLIDCPMDEQQYRDKLREKGFL
jgi:hypothetical protein